MILVYLNRWFTVTCFRNHPGTRPHSFFPYGFFGPFEGKLFRGPADEPSDFLDPDPECDAVAENPLPREAKPPAERPEDFPPKELATGERPEIVLPECIATAGFLYWGLAAATPPACPDEVGAENSLPESRGEVRVKSDRVAAPLASWATPRLDPSLQIPFEPLPPPDEKLDRPAIQLDPPPLEPLARAAPFELVIELER